MYLDVLLWEKTFMESIVRTFDGKRRHANVRATGHLDHGKMALAVAIAKVLAKHKLAL